MATNGKPTTRFTITYGDLPVESTGGSLTPVFVGPRYVVHKLAEGYAETSIGGYNINDPEAVLEFDFPKSNGGKVDTGSCALYGENVMLAISEEATPITGKISADEPSAVLVSQSVRPVGGQLTEGLNGFSITAGDKAKVTIGEKSIVCRVVDVLPSYETPVPEIQALTENTGLTNVADIVVTAEELVADVAYIATAKTVADGKVGIAISAINGDLGFYAVKEFEADKVVTFGSKSVSMTLKAEQIAAIRAGDSFVIRAFAKRASSYDRVYTNADLSSIVTEEGDTATVEFYKNVTGAAAVEIGSAYWDVTDTGVKVYDAVYLTVGGKQLRVAEADLALEYRELITEDANTMVSTAGHLASSFAGVADPLNPMGMAYAVFNTVSNSLGGASAYMIAVDEDSEAGYARAFAKAGRYEDAYGLVPLKAGETMIPTVTGIINKYSAPEVAQFKVGWLAHTSERSAVVMDKDDNGVVLIGTIADSTLTILSGDLIKGGVKEGDIVEIVNGDAVTGRVKIARVTSAATASVAGLAGEAISASCVRIVRELSATEYAESIAAEAAKLNNARLRLTVSDQLSFGGFIDVDKVYINVALASMRAALPPHAPLTDRVIPGFTITDTLGWTDDDYETMNKGGAWVVYNDIDGTVKTYHQVTTLTDGTIAEEDSAVSNGDSIAREIRAAIRPLAGGSSNASNAVIGAIEAKFHAVMASIAARDYPDELGPQFEDYSIKELYRPEGNRQRIIGRYTITGQLPLQDGDFGINLI